jgi:hypothetical protein
VVEAGRGTDFRGSIGKQETARRLSESHGGESPPFRTSMGVAGLVRGGVRKGTHSRLVWSIQQFQPMGCRYGFSSPRNSTTVLFRLCSINHYMPAIVQLQYIFIS